MSLTFMNNTDRKPKRRIRKSIILFLMGCILCGIVAAYAPGYLTKRNLKQLGYDKTAIQKILEADLQDDILSHSYYSDYLAQVICDGSLHREYMYLYTVLKSDRTLEEKDLLLYNRLVDAGYETDQLVNLYQNLTFAELTPLLVFDYQWNEQQYIDDVISNREASATGTYTLTEDYITWYRLSETIDDPKPDSLISQTYHLSESYAPQNLTALSNEHAVDGVQLVKEAADAFAQLSADSVQAGHSMYATAGYIDYATQQSAYTYYVNHMGAGSADYYTERAGSSEHQSGTAVNIALTYENTEDIVNTGAYGWLKEKAASYGFIIRYPMEKALITGRNEPAHLRYVGKKLAEMVRQSFLSYDEYYLLYMAEWNDESLIPSKAILEKTDYQTS